jgi:Domain of unknown function (DUF4149)
VSGILRYVGIINAAVWFGAGIFFAAVVLPAVFSRDLHQLFGETAYPYYSGGVALVLFRHFFVLQYVCGALAILHLLAEKLYLGRALPRFGSALVLAILGLGLVGGLWLQPRMEKYRQTMYFGQTQEQKDSGRHSFYLWHGVSQLANLFIIGGLLVNLVRVAQPVGPARPGIYYQIPS